MFQQGVKASSFALGELSFKKYSGHFWGHIETRPYMRSLAGLARCLWENRQRQEAIEKYQELLHLNPNDNQGIRYLLVNCLLAEGMDAEAEKLLSAYQESSCFMLYSQAILSFRSLGPVKSAKDLKQALGSNPHVPPYLLGVKPIPWSMPDYYSHGSMEEAIIYAAKAYDIWKSTPGALSWLEEGSKNTK